jgi:5,5'-dehydrodivanillate O-demethylase
MRYTTERGAPSDFERWHAYMIFPNLTRPAGGAGVRHEFQMRVPIDDENTLHFNYTIFAAPTGVEAPHQDRVPHYVVPTHDQDGKPILDFVLAQDIMAWSAQGPITDRAAEHLAGSDVAILAFRRMLEDQLRVMESGADPMNVFRDPTEIGDRIDVPPPISDSYDELYESGLTRFRAVYHQGYWRDDADRYGPDIDLVLELSRRIEAQSLSRS